MLRSVLAVFLGYLAMAVSTMIFLAILSPIFGITLSTTSRPAAVPQGYLLCNLAAGLISAVFGGWLTAKLAPRHPGRHAIALAVALVAFGAIFALAEKDHPAPRWYFFMLPIIGAGGTLFGGRLAYGNSGMKPKA